MNFNPVNRRKVLRAMGGSGAVATLGGTVTGNDEAKGSRDQPRPLTSSESEKTVSKALSNSDLRLILNRLRKTDWMIDPTDHIALHIPFDNVQAHHSSNFTGIDGMRLVVFPVEKRGTADEAAIAWTSERWNENFPNVVAYRAEIGGEHSGKSDELVNGQSKDVFDAKSIITYFVNQGIVHSNRNTIDTQLDEYPSEANPVNINACDCVMAEASDIDLSCVVTFSIGWAATFGSCATCGSTPNILSCAGCISSVANIGGSIPDCAGLTENVCRDFDDMPSRWYAHRCEMCLNLEPKDCEEDLDPCRCP